MFAIPAPTSPSLTKSPTSIPQAKARRYKTFSRCDPGKFAAAAMTLAPLHSQEWLCYLFGGEALAQTVETVAQRPVVNRVPDANQNATEQVRIEGEFCFH